MKTGIVKWYDVERGYGFISAQEGEDVFVHHLAIKEQGPKKDLHEGEQVQFDVIDAPKGPQAINVQKY